jgi:hypothetical protein
LEKMLVEELENTPSAKIQIHEVGLVWVPRKGSWKANLWMFGNIKLLQKSFFNPNSLSHLPFPFLAVWGINDCSKLFKDHSSFWFLISLMFMVKANKGLYDFISWLYLSLSGFNVELVESENKN